MEKDESMNSFFTKISYLKDQLLAFGLSVVNDDLIQTTFDGISSTWEAYLVTINDHEVQLNFKRLWHDCLREESQIQTRVCPYHEENLAHVANLKKGKGNEFFQKHKGNGNFKGKPKFDVSKIICCNCNKPRHFARDFFSGKRKCRYHSTTTEEKKEP